MTTPPSSRLVRLGVPALAALLVSAGLASPAAAARFGLVVGIDAYEAPIPPLKGAVNDARDIAAALERSGAKRVVMLLDKAATKAAVEGAFKALLAEASSGDTLIFTYAGHGTQEPARDGDPEEPDGLDENFPLAGYGLGERLTERIVDNEIAAWLKEAEERNVRVIFVADACHSGTMYRAVSLGVTTRAAPRLKIDRAELLNFAPPAPAVPEAIGPNANVTFLAGVSDERLVPEVQIDGVARGALSYAFARSLEGAADSDGDGTVTEKELNAFVRTTVQQRTDSQQVPQSFPPVSRGIPVFEGVAGGDAGAVAVAMKAAAAAPLPLAYRGGAGPAAVEGAVVVADEGAAELVYDVPARRVEKSVAGVVAEDVGPEALPGIVAKWRAIAVVKAAAGGGVVAFAVAGPPRTHQRGDKLTVALVGSEKPFMTLFNLPPNGRVEHLYPLNEAERREDWRGRTLSLPLMVKDPPFGSEHLVAILSDEPLDELHRALKGLARPEAAVALPELLLNAVAGQTIAVGIADVFTSGGE